MLEMRAYCRMVALSIAVTSLACAGRARNQSEPRSAEPAPTPSAETTSTARAAASAPALAPDTASGPGWLAVDSAARTATLTLETNASAGAPSALIAGHRAGDARVIIPVGWTVKWSWRNGDSAASHSLVVMVQREKIPLEGGRPAFSNAMTRGVTSGLPPGGTDETGFVAEEAGWYWLLCGVPNHALAGEWLELRVDPEAKTASVEIKR